MTGTRTRDISKQVTYNSILLLSLAYLSRRSLPFFIVSVVLQSATVGFLVAICSYPAVNYTTLLGKSKVDGSFHWWSYLLFYPYLSVVRGCVYARRNNGKEPPYNEVCEGIFVGSWPFKVEDVPQGEPAIIDCTCELPRSDCVKGLPYLCIPVWDSRSPLPEDLTSAVKWACEMIKQKKPVLIHCAHGHGRSVTVACALLVYMGIADCAEAAYNLIKTQRPKVRMNSSQMNTLEKWLKMQQQQQQQ